MCGGVLCEDVLYGGVLRGGGAGDGDSLPNYDVLYDDVHGGVRRDDAPRYCGVLRDLRWAERFEQPEAAQDRQAQVVGGIRLQARCRMRCRKICKNAHNRHLHYRKKYTVS